MFDRGGSFYLWQPADYLRGRSSPTPAWADLAYVARALPVPAIIELGVVAHAPRARLAELAATGDDSRVGRAWGAASLAAIRRMLDQLPTAVRLKELQRSQLQPLESRLARAERCDRDMVLQTLNSLVMA